MATITKTSTTKNEVRYRVRVVTGHRPDGTAIQQMRTYRTEREAKTEVARWEAGIANGTQVATPRQSVADLLKDWLARSAARVRPSTLSGYSYTVEHYVLPRVATLQMRDATPLAMQRLLDAMPTPKTAGRVRRHLHIAFAEAERLGVLGINPVARTTVPASPSEVGQAWAADEARRFLAAVADDHYQPYWTVALRTGMRPSEIIGLTWDRLDLDAGTLTVAAARATVRNQTFEGGPKSRAGKRTIALPPALVAVLRAHRITQLERRLLLGGRWQDHNLVCTSEVGTPVRMQNLGHRFARLCARAGVPRIRPYDMRHTAASVMMERGADLKAASEVMGHSDPRLTARVYQHAYGSMRAHAVTLLGDALDGPETTVSERA